MLPVVRGESFTRTRILVYSLLLVAFTLVPVATGLFGGLYLGAAAILGIAFVFGATSCCAARPAAPRCSSTSGRSPTSSSCSARWRPTGSSSA